MDIRRLRLHRQEKENPPHRGDFESLKLVKGKVDTFKNKLKREELKKDIETLLLKVLASKVSEGCCSVMRCKKGSI